VIAITCKVKQEEDNDSGNNGDNGNDYGNDDPPEEPEPELDQKYDSTLSISPSSYFLNLSAKWEFF
jgi:hypothetical protein